MDGKRHSPVRVALPFQTIETNVEPGALARVLTSLLVLLLPLLLPLMSG